MKVILLQKIKGVGNMHDVKNVPDGYAQNFLFPKKLAEIATPAALDRLHKAQEFIRVEKEVGHALIKKYLSEITDKEVIIKRKASETGHLFASIHEKDIAEALFAGHKSTIDLKYIVLKQPIKELGQYTIPIEAEGQHSSIILLVERES